MRALPTVATCPSASSRIASWVAAGRSSTPTIAPPCITAIRSLMPRISGSSDEIIRMARPRPASSLMRRWISALAPTSTPWVGSSRIRTTGARRQPAGERHFLLVASRQVTRGGFERGGLDSELLDEPGGRGALAARSRESRTERPHAESPAWCWPRSASRGSRRGGGDLRERSRSRARRPATGNRS